MNMMLLDKVLQFIQYKWIDIKENSKFQHNRLINTALTLEKNKL